PRTPSALLMQIARARLAPGARLAHEQHGGGMGRNLLQLSAQLLHEAALADGDDERRRQELPGLAPTLAGIERALHRAQQLRERQRLLDVVKGPEARRLDRRLHRAVA